MELINQSQNDKNEYVNIGVSEVLMIDSGLTYYLK